MIFPEEITTKRPLALERVGEMKNISASLVIKVVLHHSNRLPYIGGMPTKGTNQPSF